MNIKALVAMAKVSSYDESNKKKFKSAAKRWLKELAERMELVEGSYDIRFNEGGIAVSGEATLHHDTFYIQVSDSGCFLRSVKSRKDFTGGPNIWVEGFGESYSMQEIVNKLVSIQSFAPQKA